SMRWGTASRSNESLRWVRPLQGIIAILGGDVVPFEIEGIASGRTTVGHRFMSSGEIEIAGVDHYADKLRAGHVILDANEREQIILDGAKAACEAEGLTLVEDPALLAENAGLTEWPVPLLGRFDDDFLDVPPEVITLTMATNQKYFSVAGADGELTNAFVCTANLETPDNGAAIVDGNRKVLAARLADARFFWEQDKKVPLEQQAEKLKDIVFHEKLGTVADKVERVAKLAEWLATEGIVPNCDPAKARRAAQLAKADLVTGMVYEFPELQGIMGGYYAEAQGEDPEVAAAIRDHYKPVGQNDDVPTAPVTVAVSLADKLDTVISFFAINETPSGSRDPFALRRASLSVASLLLASQSRLRFSALLKMALLSWIEVQLRHVLKEPKFSLTLADLEDGTLRLTSFLIDRYMGMADTSHIRWFMQRVETWDEEAADNVLPFFADRLKVQQREAGVRHDLIDAVFALGGEDDIVRLLARVKALQAFMETPDGDALLAGYKRAANILKAEAKKGTLPEGVSADPPQNRRPSEGRGPSRNDPTSDDGSEMDSGLRRNDGGGETNPSLATPAHKPDPAEAELARILDEAVPEARAAIADERFDDAMRALAALRGPIDSFFEDVIVNADDADTRAYRLGLLARIRNAVHEVADFSKIEG
ncbi:MAG: glycine--tRNA ligase subunit beta, partial [Pacificimonas sp.]